MQQVNDDMDELFRRAAENYPLNTGSADWSAMAQKLSVESNTSANIPEKKEDKRRFLWLLLLLIPFALFYYNYYFHPAEKLSASSKNLTGRNSPVEQASKNIHVAITQTAKTIAVQPIKSSPTNYVSHLNNTTRLVNVPLNNNYNTLAGRAASTTKDENVIKAEKTESESIAQVEVNNKDDKAQNENDVLSKNLQENADAKKQNEKSAPAINNDTPSVKKAQKKTVKQKGHGLYAGIIISPDVSTVKFQPVKNVGINMGVVAGYKFKNFSLESGVLWDQKDYYTDGKYFNTKNITLRPYTNINEANGVCYMIEVPIAVNYFFAKRFSASAGFSSYFMKKEKYDYSIATSSGGQYPYSTTYKRPSSNLFATVNMGIAYNYAINKSINIIIQPYAKLPLKGIGVGSLPIMSTGLNLSVTKKISR